MIGQPGRCALGRIQVGGFAQLDRHAGLAQQVFLLRDEKLDDAATHGAATDDPNPEICAGHDEFSCYLLLADVAAGRARPIALSFQIQLSSASGWRQLRGKEGRAKNVKHHKAHPNEGGPKSPPFSLSYATPTKPTRPATAKNAQGNRRSLEAD